MSDESGYRPMMPEDRAARIRAWQDAVYENQERTEETIEYLGLELRVPPEVHRPAPMSHLLGEAVLAEVRETDRVLDMGTGSGVNAILAASRSRDVVAVDVNPFAVECARENAMANGVADWVRVLESDVFQAVEGTFDLIVFDPPFRWFAPRDVRERGTTDEDYAGLTTFFREVDGYLRPDGRILIFFGTSADLEYLHALIRAAGLERETVASEGIVKDGLEVEYFTYRLTR